MKQLRKKQSNNEKKLRKKKIHTEKKTEDWKEKHKKVWNMGISKKTNTKSQHSNSKITT